MTFRQWVLFTALLLAIVFVVGLTCGHGTDAQAATIAEDPQVAATTFTETAVAYGRSGQCWEFGRWQWQNTDSFGRLRFGWGHDLIACTNKAATRWTALPTYDIWHWVGYWQFDKQSRDHSKLGYSWLDSTSYWKFRFDALNLPLATKERTLRCRYYATNHTATCTLYG